MVAKFKTDPFELFHLKQLWLEWKAELQSFYLKLEFQLTNNLTKDFTAASGQDSSSLDRHVEQLNDLLKHYLNPTNPVKKIYFIYKLLFFIW